MYQGKGGGGGDGYYMIRALPKEDAPTIQFNRRKATTFTSKRELHIK